MVPMPPQMQAARPAEPPRPDKPVLSEEDMRKKIQEQRIRRPAGQPGNGSGRVMIAGLGAVDKPSAGGGVPSFLAGPSPEKKEARRLIEAVQRDLAQIIATLARQLPVVRDNLNALAKIEGIDNIVANEGVDLNKAGDVAAELQEALDRAAK